MNEQAYKEEKKNRAGLFEKGYASYVIGFVASIALTIGAYFLVIDNGSVALFDRWTIVLIITIFALAQFAIQLIFFMHLRILAAPRWKFLVFLFMFLIVIVIVGGSLWIMHSLNSRMMMSTAQEEQYMNDQAGL